MATYRVRVRGEVDGSWVASAIELPNCWSRGKTREEALGKLRDEIRYRIEYCPCSGVSDEFVRVEVQVAQEPRRPQSPRETATPPAGPSTSAAAPSWGASRPATPAALSGAAGCPSPLAEGPQVGAVPSVPSTEAGAAGGRTRPQGWRRWDD